MIYKWREKKAKLEGQEYQNKLVFTLGGGGGWGGGDEIWYNAEIPQLST